METQGKIDVLIVEPSGTYSEGLQLYLGRQADMAVVGIARGVEDVQSALTDGSAAVVLIDVDSAPTGWLDFLGDVQAVAGSTRTIVITAFCSDSLVCEAMKSHVWGLVDKAQPLEELADAIRQVQSGRLSYAPSAMARLVPEAGRMAIGEIPLTRLNSLTRRERQLFALLASGLRLQEACDELNVSYKTGDKHKLSLMKKLAVSDRVHLARYAMREHLVEP